METKSQAHRWERASAPLEDWRNLIRSSIQEDEVLTLVRDHMARWAPEEIARLPQDCRPGRVRDADDISRWAFELASTHCAQGVGPEDEPFLDRMLEFVTQAAIRLAELKAEPQEGGELPS
jgi:hypothetical protein